MSGPRRSFAAALLVLVFNPTLALAQDGFTIQTADGDNRLVFGMVAQTDGRFSLDDPRPVINTFTIRKLRPTLTGRVARYFDFKLMPDFGNGTTVVQEQDAIPGGSEKNYQYNALPAGAYTFICSIHPVAPMTGTLTVK